jgi:hypothetical protein
VLALVKEIVETTVTISMVALAERPAALCMRKYTVVSGTGVLSAGPRIGTDDTSPSQDGLAANLCGLTYS